LQFSRQRVILLLVATRLFRVLSLLTLPGKMGHEGVEKVAFICKPKLHPRNNANVLSPPFAACVEGAQRCLPILHDIFGCHPCAHILTPLNIAVVI
jgi:hypothetical protein